MFTKREIEQVFRAYVEAALWSSTDDDGKPLDRNYTAEEITPDSLDQMRRDVVRFLGLEGDPLIQLIAFEDVREFTLAARTDLTCVGHDFWFTRNRMGVGFWSRDAGGVGDYLTERAHGYGEVWLCVGEDGLYLY